jgi:hypothetical protein
VVAGRISGFEWVDVLLDKIREKHGVEPEYVEGALLNADPPPLIRKAQEGRYRALARSKVTVSTFSWCFQCLSATWRA